MAIAFIGLLQSALTTYGVAPSLDDFRAIYCGERVVLARHDPYLTEPLRTCEHQTHKSDTEAAWTATPYPFPGYTAAVFLPFGIVPFKIAKLAWMLTLAVTFGITAAATSKIVGARAWVVAAIFAPTLAFLNFTYGDPVNVAVAAVALAALALDRGKAGFAAIAAAVSMIEPHIGLPACCGLLVFVRETRRTIVACGIALAALSFATVGIAPSIEYATTFLPLHAHAEVYAVDQYSLAHVLFLAGIAPRVALFVANVQYVLAIGFGLFAAYRLTKHDVSRAVLVLVPVATAMLGGPFVHDVEIAAALPAALVLASRSAVARAAVSLLAVQWGLAWRGLVVMVTASALALSSVALPGVLVWRRVTYGLSVVVGVLVLNAMLVLPQPSAGPLPVGTLPVAVTERTPSPVSWEWSIRLSPTGSDMRKRAMAIKLPTWIALAIVPLAFVELELGLIAMRLRRPERSDVQLS